jgi:hypothetical protein
MAERSELIGYAWLAAEYGVVPVQPFPVFSQLGKKRTTCVENGQTKETYLPAMRPQPTLAGHLGFALKYEGVCLEFLARLFAILQEKELADWANHEPSGQYARRAGFFYEWLTGKRLDFPGVTVGNYVSALSEANYLTASKPHNVPRWRIRNNLTGNPDFCPLVRRTSMVQELEAYDCAAKLRELETEFGTDILQRSVVWLTIKESRASFQIEHEEAQSDRIKRFATAMEKRCGTVENPLSPEFLAALQADILGERALHVGLRQSPVFIGESAFTSEVVYYVAPAWQETPALLEGLHTFDQTTVGRSSLIRAAVLSFGFVYIHPMTDGNGRISRFLVNDTLRRDGAAPAPFILPISATITRSVINRASYDRVLEVFSRPFMDRYAVYYSFGAFTRAKDNILTNFQFSAYEDAHFTWSFPDLTHQTEFLGQVIRETVETEMRQEASYLLNLYRVRERVKNVIEAPDIAIDRLIRSVRENKGVISGKLVKEFPLLSDPVIAEAVAAAITETF